MVSLIVCKATCDSVTFLEELGILLAFESFCLKTVFSSKASAAASAGGCCCYCCKVKITPR
jgi:hypothetical protein